ncbi:hypothetical protein EP331_06100 [bacterium]|nr:MAG: hypothetical protein EP331_06100 [bacterium]
MFKKTIHLILLFSFLISFTEVRQFLRVPVFISHYETHQTSYPDLSIWEFTYQHYVDELTQDADSETDANLPFRSIPTLKIWQSFTAIHHNIDSTNQMYSPIPFTELELQPVSEYDFIFHFSIWHPPQV